MNKDVSPTKKTVMFHCHVNFRGGGGLKKKNTKTHGGFAANTVRVSSLASSSSCRLQKIGELVEVGNLSFFSRGQVQL